jgi:hypothetical protein
LDESFAQANRIEALLNDPVVARDLTGSVEDAGTPGQSGEDEDSDGAA